MMDSYENYQREFLGRERIRLSAIEGVRPEPGAQLIRFPVGNGKAGDVAKKFLQVLRVINRHIEEASISDRIFSDDNFLQEVDSFWRPLLPEWFAQQFSVLRQADGIGFDLEGLSGKEIARRLEGARESSATVQDALGVFVSDFGLTERTWFYAGHQIENDSLDIAIERSEDPSRSHSLTSFLKYCGAKQPEPPASSFLARAFPKYLFKK